MTTTSCLDVLLIPAVDEMDDPTRLEEELRALLTPASNALTIGAAAAAISGLAGALTGGLGPVVVGSATFPSAMATVGPVVGTVLGAWLQARIGRKVQVKLPDGLEVVAQTPEELEKVLRLIMDHGDQRPRIRIERWVNRVGSKSPSE